MAGSIASQPYERRNERRDRYLADHGIPLLLRGAPKDSVGVLAMN